jgi:feruloyl-CoA synthase
VNVGGIRAQLLEMIGGVARDVVISGPNSEDGASSCSWTRTNARSPGATASDCANMAADAIVTAHVEAAIDRYNLVNTTSSRRIVSFALMPRPLESSSGELTEKGTVNQRVILARETETCNRLHSQPARREGERA